MVSILSKLPMYCRARTLQTNLTRTVYYGKYSSQSIRDQNVIQSVHGVISTLSRTRFSTSTISPTFSSTSSSEITTPVNDEDIPWENLYKFHHIRTFVILSRLKILQTIFTFTVLPSVFYACFITETEPVTKFWGLVAVSVFASFMLLVITRISQRTVMILYVNPGRDRLRISHLTFWGKRRESYFDVSDFLPVSHTRQSWTDPYVRLQIPERGNFRFYFAPRSGNIVDPVLLKQLFD